MRYPTLSKQPVNLYIPAPSAGVGHKLESFDESLSILKKEGFHIIETPSVRNLAKASNTNIIRAQEFDSCFKEDDHGIVVCAAGGDFLFDILDLLDYDLIQSHMKWVVGASDPTSLLYTLTVKYDIATLYGFNAGSFELSHMEDAYMKNAISFLKGELPLQSSSLKHAKYADFMEEYNGFDTPTRWLSKMDSFNGSGRCIGGCLDCLKDLIGTPFDETVSFVDKYHNDGTIFYFDNFAMSAENVYRTLLQMKYAGWFEYTKVILFGRVLFQSSETGMSYQEAYEKALGDIPYIMEADIGHTDPYMTMVNGAMLHLNYHNEMANLSFEKVI